MFLTVVWEKILLTQSIQTLLVSLWSNSSLLTIMCSPEATDKPFLRRATLMWGLPVDVTRYMEILAACSLLTSSLILQTLILQWLDSLQSATLISASLIMLVFQLLGSLQALTEIYLLQPRIMRKWARVFLGSTICWELILTKRLRILDLPEPM